MSLTVLPQLKKQVAPGMAKNRNNRDKADEQFVVGQIRKCMSLFFESRTLGIQALPATDKELKDALLSYHAWTEFLRSFWKNHEPQEKIRDLIISVGSGIYEYDKTLLANKSAAPEIEQKMACWAAVSVFIEQSVAEAMDFLESKSLNTAKIAREGIASEPAFKSFMDIHGPDHIALLMSFVIFLGRLEDINAVYEFMYQSLPVYGMSDDIFKCQKKNTRASKLCGHILDAYFSDTFKEILEQRMVSENFIIDVVFNDSVKEFIINL